MAADQNAPVHRRLRKTVDVAKFTHVLERWRDDWFFPLPTLRADPPAEWTSTPFPSPDDPPDPSVAPKAVPRRVLELRAREKNAEAKAPVRQARHAKQKAPKRRWG